VLVNAICFKGEWKSPFEEDQTKNRPFTHADGSTTNKAIMRAPMVDDARYGAFMADGKFFDTPRMARKSETEGLYPDADGFALVELPYKGDDLSMVVIAPNRADGLAALEATLTPAKVNAWIKKLKQRPTQVYLPKFTLGTDYKLGDANNPCTLKRMGMQRAFVDPRHPKGARFNGMCASDDPSYRLFVTLVQHNAFIDVNEKGTEAAAASAVLMRVPVSADPRLPFVPEFKADRPFLFLIREKSTGSILFIGRMLDPTDSPNSTLDVPL
jgi:serine protease inhibitor